MEALFDGIRRGEKVLESPIYSDNDGGTSRGGEGAKGLLCCYVAPDLSYES